MAKKIKRFIEPRVSDVAAILRMGSDEANAEKVVKWIKQAYEQGKQEYNVVDLEWAEDDETMGYYGC